MSRLICHTILCADVSPSRARQIAAELLALAGPERPRVFVARDRDGDTLTVKPRLDPVLGVKIVTSGTPLLTPGQIDAIIDWLKGHREDHPA